MNKLKENFGFDFWQKFGKALMVVIAVMPAAGRSWLRRSPGQGVAVRSRPDRPDGTPRHATEENPVQM